MQEERTIGAPKELFDIIMFGIVFSFFSLFIIGSYGLKQDKDSLLQRVEILEQKVASLSENILPEVLVEPPVIKFESPLLKQKE